MDNYWLTKHFGMLVVDVRIGSDDYGTCFCSKFSVKDGKYILNILIAPFENDASPSKPSSV